MTDPDNLQKKNRRTGMIVGFVVAGMIGLSFASVPLYRLFCQITGFGGTTQVAAAVPAEGEITDRIVTIRFNADTSPELPWTFKAEQPAIEVKVGQQGLTSYVASNMTGQATGGTAVYNVTPPKAGKYFKKVQCFCFAEQILEPRQSVHMPVMFFVDPAFAQDRDMEDVTTITLSYTFYSLESEALEAALEDFYNRPAVAHVTAPDTVSN